MATVYSVYLYAPYVRTFSLMDRRPFFDVFHKHLRQTRASFGAEEKKTSPTICVAMSFLQFDYNGSSLMMYLIVFLFHVGTLSAVSSIYLVGGTWRRMVQLMDDNSVGIVPYVLVP